MPASFGSVVVKAGEDEDKDEDEDDEADEAETDDVAGASSPCLTDNELTVRGMPTACMVALAAAVAPCRKSSSDTATASSNAESILRATAYVGVLVVSESDAELDVAATLATTDGSTPVELAYAASSFCTVVFMLEAISDENDPLSTLRDMSSCVSMTTAHVSDDFRRRDGVTPWNNAEVELTPAALATPCKAIQHAHSTQDLEQLNAHLLDHPSIKLTRGGAGVVVRHGRIDNRTNRRLDPRAQCTQSTTCMFRLVAGTKLRATMPQTPKTLLQERRGGGGKT